MSKVEMADPEIDISSDDEDEESMIPYSKRSDWTDVTPIEQDDGPFSVVSIRYTPIFAETFDYFRAILANHEISERALQLTQDCIKLNPSNYTVWHYRRVLLEKLNKNLRDELEYIEAVISDNHKNYQVWEHYKFVLNRIKQNVDEKILTNVDLNEIVSNVKNFIKKVLAEDVKNYHAWQHLQWFILEWNQWTGELDFVKQLIDDDIRNNSAWNHRFYVTQHTTGFTEDVAQSEVDFTLKLIELAPNNESSWNYLLGVIRHSHKNIDSFVSVTQMCEKLSKEKETCSSYLLSFMTTYMSEQLCQLKEKADEHDKQRFKEIYTRTIELYNKLASEVDKLRAEYWKYHAQSLTEKYQSMVA